MIIIIDYSKEKEEIEIIQEKTVSKEKDFEDFDNQIKNKELQKQVVNINGEIVTI